MNNFKMEELIPIVAELTEKYTSKESTSVSYNTAKQLMNAVIYCINEVEWVDSISGNSNLDNSEPDHSDSYTHDVKNMGEEQNAKLAYKKGYELIVKKVLKTKALFESIMLDFNAYRNRAYYETVVLGMPSFFLYYDPKFNPQNHILTLDYQTIKSVQDLCGIDAIYEYLKNTKLEQDFLKEFPEQYITTLLSRYNIDYEELFDNIGSIVLRNIIACMIVGKNITNPTFQESDFIILKKFVNNSTKEELEMKVSNLIRILVDQGYNHNDQLFNYLIEEIKNISFELLNAAENDCLDVMFLL